MAQIFEGDRKAFNVMQTKKDPKGKQKLSDNGHVSQGKSTKSKSEELADKSEGFGGSPDEHEDALKKKNDQEDQR